MTKSANKHLEMKNIKHLWSNLLGCWCILPICRSFKKSCELSEFVGGKPRHALEATWPKPQGIGEGLITCGLGMEKICHAPLYALMA